MTPYSQYLCTYAKSFPDAMGQLSSSLVVNGASVDDIQYILQSSELIHEVEYGNNIALTDSSALILYTWLKHDSDHQTSNIVQHTLPTPDYLGNGDDWIIWWAVSTVLHISQYEHISAVDVLSVMPLSEVVQNGIKYHTTPYFDCFYYECYLPKKQSQDDEARDE